METCQSPKTGTNKDDTSVFTVAICFCGLSFERHGIKHVYCREKAKSIFIATFIQKHLKNCMVQWC